jgi:hypothetical protein
MARGKIVLAFRGATECDQQFAVWSGDNGRKGRIESFVRIDDDVASLSHGVGSFGVRLGDSCFLMDGWLFRSVW